MTSTLVSPDLCVEIHRYDEPEHRYRFFYLEPKEDDTGLLWIQHPFRAIVDGELVPGPGYHESRKDEVLSTLAEWTRVELRRDGYVAHPLGALDDSFAHWVIHSHAPIEFQRMLDARDPEWTKRVTVWIKDPS